MTKVKFGVAIEAAKEGKLIAREGWNGKGMFVFQRPADELSKEFIIQSVRSLPPHVKDYYDMSCRASSPSEYEQNLKDTVRFSAYLCMKAADGSIVNGWLASQTDILAEDWEILT